MKIYIVGPSHARQFDVTGAAHYFKNGEDGNFEFPLPRGELPVARAEKLARAIGVRNHFMNV
jgi:hypothetical protein